MFQREVWKFYADTLAALQPIDCYFFLGDAVDGKGERSGGTEEIENCRVEQADMATACIRQAEADHVYMVYGCLTAGHRILTRDLRWVPVETLKPGDELLAFEENLNANGNRRFIGSTVLANKAFQDEAYELSLSDGTTITANGEHQFLLRRGGRGYDWVSVEHLYKIAHPSTPGFGDENGLSDYMPMPFPRCLPVWDTATSYEAGYLSGFFDGEGTVHQPVKDRHRRLVRDKESTSKEHGFMVTATQKNNQALAYANECLCNLGFTPSNLYHDHGADTHALTMLGGFSEKFRFLGSVRPKRLLARLKIERLGLARNLAEDDPPRLVDIKHVGIRTLYGLSTTSKTYISDGFLSHNTPYHTGVDEDWEDLVARNLGATISGREFVEIEGLMFDLAHFVGGSSVPYSRATALLRDMVWNIIWARDGKQPDADYVIRGHVHHSLYHEEYGKVVEILPALQGYGSKFGVRKCRATVDIGFIHLDVEDGRVSRCPHILKSDLLEIEPKRPFNCPTSMETLNGSEE
jgi:hypothetical protein